MPRMELIEQGLLKRAGALNKTWDEIGKPFNTSGEVARQIVKLYCKDNGLLKGKYESGRERILIMNDLHIPDHQEEKILETVKKHKDVNMIILVGDILDCKAVSAWFDEEISILDYEMQIAHQLLLKIRSITKAKIILVKGNHEERVNSHYAKNAKAMGTSVVETEILYKLARGFEIKRKGKKTRTVFEPIDDVHYCEGRSYMYGDLLVNHPSAFSRDYMKTVNNMWTGKLKLKYPTAKVILIGHTHQLGMVFAEDGRVLIENGCMCHPAGYADKDDRPYKLQQYGYTYLEMKDSKVDIESIKVQTLGFDTLEQNINSTDDIDDI